MVGRPSLLSKTRGKNLALDKQTIPMHVWTDSEVTASKYNWPFLFLDRTSLHDYNTLMNPLFLVLSFIVLGFYRWRESLGLVRSKYLPSWHHTVLAFLDWIHYYMFPKSYMMVTKVSQDPNWLYTYVFRTYFSLLLVRIEQCRSDTSGWSDWNFLNIFTIFRPKCVYFLHIFGVFMTKCVYLRPNEYIDVQWVWLSVGYKGFTDCLQDLRLGSSGRESGRAARISPLFQWFRPPNYTFLIYLRPHVYI